ncbi:MAG: conserved repeat domain protein, partial [Solirubrobacterales bacterium]|nr:conserved repeat domain protein [Solirubrobacterales bacterium]
MPKTHTLDSVANKGFLFFSALLAAIALVVPAVASAAGEPNISLDKRAPEQALLGTTQPVQLVVDNPVGQPRGYNLSFRDVLPKGVTYVVGSSSKIAPTVLVNAPNVGETTLLFENVSDLSAGSEYVLAYEVEPSTTFFKLAETHIYTHKAEAFVTKEPRNKPNFAANGEVVAGSFKGNDGAEATTELTAIEIEKSEPNPEGEILRGVHEHQTVYTLTVKNNKVGPTQGTELRLGKPDAIGIEDFLPAGLEFLGCGTTDNTTNAIGTNPGSAEEYPGSGAIDPGNAPSVPNCIAPYYVKTEEVDPPGPKPLGIYTHVKWEGPESLAKGEKYKLEYVAAIPILRNSLTWSGAEPSAESLGQIADLNNNQGPETFDEEELTNIARATGEYENVDVQDSDEMTRTAEDLAIQKSVNQGQIFDEAKSIWSLRLETSEYRWDEPVSITDELPNGLCPLGTKDFEGPSGSPSAECQPTEPTKFHPVVKYVKGGAKPAGAEEQVEYSLAEEQAAGGYKLAFDDSTVNALEHLEPSQELLITFPTATQTFYQLNFEDDKARPVLTGDSWTNHVETNGTAFNRCYTGEGATAVADPNCEVPGANRIFPHVETGIPVTDVSAATQEAGGVEIEKTVRKNEGLVPEECKGPTSEYVKGLEGFPGGLPLYRPGDEICWRLVVKFAANLYAGHPVVSDFIPTDEEYVKGSAFEGEENTIESKFDTVAAETEEALEWEIGKAGAESVEKEQLFEWRFKTKVKATPSSEPGEISGNLMKFVYSNTEGETFPLRDRAEVKRTEPALTLTKRVLEVNGAPAGEGATVAGGDAVKYGIEIPNTKGTLKAEDIEVWDELPAEFECGVDIEESSISNGGKCAGTGRIVWEGVEVGPGATAGPLTYVVKVPIDVAPGHKFENEAGVTQFKSETNSITGEKFTYFPEDNINPAVTPEVENAGPARDTASVVTTGAALTKSAKAENGENKATIGEIVHYTVTATIPAGSTLYGTPAITDTVPSNLEYIAGSTTAELSPGAGGTIKTPTVVGALITVDLEAPYVNPEGSGADVVTIEFDARVKDIAANVRGTNITNHALFKFEDNPEVGRTVELPAQVTTPVVEPNLVVGKTQTAPGGIVAPGDTVDYTVTATNSVTPGNVSTAYEVALVDTIPAGMEVVTGSLSEGGTVVGKTIVWKVAPIAPGATVTRTYQLKVEEPATAASTFKNEVVGTTQSLPDKGGSPPAGARTSTFTEGAYKAAEKGYESKTNTSVRLVGATVSKEVAPGEGTIGTNLTYKLHMNLPPQINFFNTTVVDTLPNGIGYDAPAISAKCVKGCEDPVEGAELAPREGPGGTTLLGWYFGKELAAAPAERELLIEFKAHIEDKKNGGGEVEAGETLINHVVGLYNEAEGAAPTKVPTPGASGFSEETPEATAPTEVLEPEITLTKTATAAPELGPGLIEPASKITYTLTVTNEGTSPAFETEVTDSPTPNLHNFTPVVGAEFATSAAGAPPVWVIPTIAKESSVTLTYTAELIGSESLTTGDEAENEADVPVYFGLPEPERKVAEAVRTYEGPEASQTFEVELPLIELEKIAGPGVLGGNVVNVGEVFPWHLIARNNSGAIAKEAVVVDTLPENWTYVAGTGKVGGATAAPAESTVGASQVLTWTVPGNLTETEIFYEAIPSAAAAVEPGLGPNLNTAKVTAKDATGSTEDATGEYADTAEAAAELIAPELKVEKTPDNGALKAGEEGAYTIKITNEGSGVANGVTVSDVLSTGQEFKAPATANPEAGFAPRTPEAEANAPGAGETTLGWTIASIAPTKSVEITVPIRALPSLAENTGISDVAEASTPQEVTPEGKDEGSFNVTQESDLAIVKTASPETANAGEDIDYSLEVINNGPSDATGIVVTDPLPEHTKLEGALEAGCTEAARIITCELAELKAAAGENTHVFHFTVEVEPGTKGIITNIAKVEGDQPDENLANNESEAETPLEGLAKLSIVKTGPEDPVLLGQDFTYKLHVDNKGPSTALETEVTDPLPMQVKFVAATTTAGTCEEAPAGAVKCELGDLLPGAEVEIEVEVEAAEVGAFENEAEVHSPVFDPDETDNHSKAPAEIVPAADLSIVKTAPATVEPNGELTYKLQVEDHGPSTAHKVVVTDPLPAGTDFVKASEGCSVAGTVVTCEVPGGELAVGEVTDFQITVHVPYALGGAPLTNTASVTAEEGDPHIEDNSSTVTTTVGPDADLAITKTMGKAEAGKPLVYTLAITNHGPSASSAVTVKDTLPAGTTFRSAAPSQGTCSASGQTVTCQLGQLASGGSAQVSLTVEVAATATGSIRNVASVEGPEPDPDKSNNESAVEGPITPAPPGGTPNLKVVKTADTSTPQVGVPFDYDVAISNFGDADAKNVKVVDTLNGPVKVVSIDAGPGKCAAAGSKIECTIPSIAVGKTVHVTYSVVAESTGPLSNTASAMASNGEKAPANNHAVKAVKAKAPKANFTLAK